MDVIVSALKQKFGADSRFGYCPVSVTASTGMSAVNINGGNTLHSWSGIGVHKKLSDQLAGALKWSKRKWKTCKVLVIDEISMISKDLFVRNFISESEHFIGGGCAVNVCDVDESGPYWAHLTRER